MVCCCLPCCDDKDEESKTHVQGIEDEDDIISKKRSCTDVFCLGIFILFIIGLFAILIVGFVMGNPYRLLNGYDVSGDVCGIKNEPIEDVPQSGKDLRKYKYIFFLTSNVVRKDISEQKKIDTCLKAFHTESEMAPLKNDQKEKPKNETFIDAYLKLKEQNYTIAFLQSQSLNILINGLNAVAINKDTCRICVEKCPDNYSTFLNRCVSSGKIDVASKVYSVSGLQEFAEGLIADIENSWKEIIYMCLIALALSIVMSLIMRFFVGFIVYIVITLVGLSFVAGTIFVWVIYGLKKKHLDEQNAKDSEDSSMSRLSIDEIVPKSLFEAADQEELNWILAGAIALTIFTVIILLLLLVLKSRIQFVIQLFKEASKAVQSMPFLVFQPFWTFLALFIFLVFWTLTLVWLESAGYPTASAVTGFITYKKTSWLRALRWYNFFGLLWGSQFILACQHMVTAGAIAMWFFTRNKSTVHSPILNSIHRLIRYHMGSVALGSFLIALIKFIRAIISYMQHAYERMENGLVKDYIRACFFCCQCIMALFEKILKFISRQAYIEIAINGYHFCKAAKAAFSITTSNILRIFTLSMVGDFVLFLAKTAIVAPTILCGIKIMNDKHNSVNDWMSSHIWAPVGLAGLFSYMIASCFISVYEMAIDTTFLCFCEDLNMNDGDTKPYFMSVSLMKFVSDNADKSTSRRPRSITEVHPM